MTKKLTYEEVKNYIESQGYKLLSNKYINAHKKLRIKCSDGHIFEMNWNNFKNNQRCPTCYKKNYTSSNKLTYSYIKNFIEFYNYNLLSKEYKNANEKIKVECPAGHMYEVRFGNFQQGQRCWYCAKKSFGQHTKLKYEDIKEHIKKEGYELLSNKYVNAHKKLRIKCPQGHTFKMGYNSFQQGQRCPICYDKNIKLKYEYVKEYIEKEGYYLLSENYTDIWSKLEIKCPQGHIYKTSFHNFKYGNRCPICYFNSKSSAAEREIQEFVSQIYNGKILPNDRNTILNPNTGWNLELDAYMPEINKAIEFNGTYWHSFPDGRGKDKIKKEQCRKLGIDLLVIKEENWKNNKQTCMKIIGSFIKDNK